MKSQVSKCQKFGYGCMVTQVASTAAGMKALMDSGVRACMHVCNFTECSRKGLLANTCTIACRHLISSMMSQTVCVYHTHHVRM